MEDQEFEQRARDLIVPYQNEDYKFPGRATKEIDATGDDLGKRSAVCRQLLAEIGETRRKRESEVGELCQGDVERKVKLLREVRELAIRARFTVNEITLRREAAREMRQFPVRSGLMSSSPERLRGHERLLEQIGSLNKARDAEIFRIHQELDAQLEEAKKAEKRRLNEDIEALKEEVAQLRRPPKVGPEWDGYVAIPIPVSSLSSRVSHVIESVPTPQRVPADSGKAKKSEDGQPAEKFSLDAGSSIAWLNTREYKLTPQQFKVVKALWEAPTHSLAERHILEVVLENPNENARLRNIFKSRPGYYTAAGSQGAEEALLVGLSGTRPLRVRLNIHKP